MHADRRPLGASYWQLWGATAISAIGDGVALVAFPLLAAALTHRPLVVAGIAMAQRLPWLLVSLPLGAVADRLDRRRLMSAVDAARAVVLLVLAAVVAGGHVTLPLLYAGAFVLGVFETVYAASVHAAVPALVGRESLDRGNGYMFSALDGGQQLAGPAVGGFLFAAAVALPLLVDSVSFAASAVLVLLALRPSRARDGADTRPVRPPSTIRDDVAAGWRFFVRSRPLRLLSTVIGCLAACQAAVMSIMVLYALEVLHLSKAGFGVFMAAASIGNVVGGVIAERVRRRLSTSAVITAAALSAALAYLGVAATRRPVVACAALVLEAVAVACGNVASVSFRQRVVPDEMLGRVGNTFRMMVYGAIPLGAFAGGVLASSIGLVPTFTVAAVVQTGVTLALAGPLRREIRPYEVIDLRDATDAGTVPAPQVA